METLLPTGRPLATREQGEPAARNYIQLVPSISAAATAIAVLLSVAHEWGYFLRVGSTWLSVLSMQDYVLLSLGWLPSAALAMIVPTFLLGPMGVAYKRHRTASTYAFWLVIVLLLATILVELARSFLYSRIENSPIFLALLAAGVCLALGALVIFPIKTRGEGSKGSVASAYIALVPSILLGSFAVGAADGTTAMLDEKAGHIVRVKRPISVESSATSVETFKVRLLRNVERGILVRDFREKRNVFIPWAEIASVSETSELVKHTPRVCAYFALELCTEHPPLDSERPPENQK